MKLLALILTLTSLHIARITRLNVSYSSTLDNVFTSLILNLP